MDYLFLVIGLALLLAGANYLVESSVAIAQRAKISNFIIGLTIVGMGTSAPELFVSVSSALSGNGDIAMGTEPEKFAPGEACSRAQVFLHFA